MDKEQFNNKMSIDPSDYNTNYVSWNDNDDEGKQRAIAAMNAAVDECGYIDSKASIQSFSDLEPGISSRPGMTRSGYSNFRPNEAIPTKSKDIIAYCDNVYHTVGIVRNIIDLMGDFACQGIKLSHPDPRVQKFYRNWFTKINGKNTSERFLNNLFRTGNIIIRRQNAKISLKQRSRLFKSIGAKDTISIDELNVNNRTIPWHHTFLNPITVDVVAGELSVFTQESIYAIKIPHKLRAIINKPGSPEEKKLVKKLAPEIRKAAKSSKPFILPPDNTLVFHYKKDDWQDWAKPMINAIISDIIVLRKLKLADLSALDGAIHNIRIFKLGNLENKILPARGAASKLKNIINNNTGVGTIDIVWTPDIDMLESRTEVHKFLGETKYQPTLNAIYGGLGIPQTLTGATGAGGTTNNFVSLKTLVQRLQYGRDVLLKFWQTEMEIVKEAMGFKQTAIIEYAMPDLGDSNAEKALFVQLADRNLISDEILRDKFGLDVAMEQSRIDRDFKAREDEDKAPKYSPYSEPTDEYDSLVRIALQQGMISPREAGLDVEELVVPPEDQQQPGLPKTPSKDIPFKGRPKNAKDTTKRKTKEFKPKIKASLDLWAREAQSAISTAVTPAILQSFNKKNVRSLSSKEHRASEKIKFGILFSMTPFTQLSLANITTAFNSNSDVDDRVYSEYTSLLSSASSELNRPLLLDEMKYLQIGLYTNLFIR